ncbi:GNAT family N-acetyltransferase [Planotetraspora sp. GP83]|uniref:GNAT family N-acetyltransferase n=1 Tax=Planotetraspora sp. GP83 TaxID=3156264 RepID=UPI003516B002
MWARSRSSFHASPTSTAADGWRAHLYRLAVDPARRRQGIGSALIRAAEERLAAFGAFRADAMVLRDNERAHRAWDAAGTHPAPMVPLGQAPDISTGPSATATGTTGRPPADPRGRAAAHSFIRVAISKSPFYTDVAILVRHDLSATLP